LKSVKTVFLKAKTFWELLDIEYQNIEGMISEIEKWGSRTIDVAGKSLAKYGNCKDFFEMKMIREVVVRLA